MVANLVDRVAILVAVRRFPNMGDTDSRSLRSDSYVRMQHFLRRYTFVPFRRFLGNVWRDLSCNVSMPLFMVLWLLIFTRVCKRAVAMLWHASLLLGLRHVGGFLPIFSFLIGAFDGFFSLTQGTFELFHD
jgi:hypothetical protein